MRAMYFLGLLLHAAPLGAQDVVHNPHVTISLVPEWRAVVPGRPMGLAVRFQLEPGWHVYWENPGESGIATAVEWTLPPGFRAGGLRFPIPERLVIADVVTHVHHGEPVFVTTVDAPADATGKVRVSARVTYGICREVCVPGRAELELHLQVDRGAVTGPGWADLVARDAFRAPRPTGLNARFTVVGDTAMVELRPSTGCLTGPVTLFPRQRDVAPAAAVHRIGGGCVTATTVRLPLTGRPGEVLTGVMVSGTGREARAWEWRAARR